MRRGIALFNFICFFGQVPMSSHFTKDTHRDTVSKSGLTMTLRPPGFAEIRPLPTSGGVGSRHAQASEPNRPALPAPWNRTPQRGFLSWQMFWVPAPLGHRNCCIFWGVRIVVGAGGFLGGGY